MRVRITFSSNMRPRAVQERMESLHWDTWDDRQSPEFVTISESVLDTISSKHRPKIEDVQLAIRMNASDSEGIVTLEGENRRIRILNSSPTIIRKEAEDAVKALSDYAKREQRVSLHFSEDVRIYEQRNHLQLINGPVVVTPMEKLSAVYQANLLDFAFVIVGPIAIVIFLVFNIGLIFAGAVAIAAFTSLVRLLEAFQNLRDKTIQWRITQGLDVE